MLGLLDKYQCSSFTSFQLFQNFCLLHQVTEMDVSLGHVADSLDALFHHVWIFWKDLALKGREVDLLLLEEQPTEELLQSFIQIFSDAEPESPGGGVLFCCQKELGTDDDVQDEAADCPVVSDD